METKKELVIMIRLTSTQKPKNRINLYGTRLLALGYNKKSIMIRSKQLNTKLQINLKD